MCGEREKVHVAAPQLAPQAPASEETPEGILSLSLFHSRVFFSSGGVWVAKNYSRAELDWGVKRHSSQRYERSFRQLRWGYGSCWVVVVEESGQL